MNLRVIASFLVLAVLLLGACDAAMVNGEGPSLGSSSAALGPNPLGVKTETICFSVHNPGDPIPIPITGTRFSQRSLQAVTPRHRVVLLLHGAVETREIFDGGKAGIEIDSSFARRLARAGYVVVTVDRAGYGESPYPRGPGSGWWLSFDSYVEMTHEIITQLREGTYTTRTGTGCGGGPQLGAPASSVILGGHSIAGGEAMLYAARYHDIDALVSLGWNNTGTASIATGFFLSWIVPQFLQGKDYVTFFPPGAAGVSADCVLGLFSQPLAQTAVDPRVVALECANQNLGTAPSGELAGSAALRQANLASLGKVGPTPALLAFADLDTMVAGANNPAGDPDHSGQEVALWQQQCNCDVSSYTQPLAGHAMFFPETMPDLVEHIVAWLAGRGLGPR